MAKTSLKLVGVLDGEILNYEVLDTVLQNDMFFIFAVQQDPVNEGIKLLMMQIVYDTIL